MAKEYEDMPSVINTVCQKCESTFKTDESTFKTDKYAQPQETVCPRCLALPNFFATIGQIASTTYYTVVAEEQQPQWPFYSLISTPGARQLGKKPSIYGYFADPGEASQETQAQYGNDIEYVTPVQFMHISTRREEQKR